MNGASEEITKDPARLRTADREDIAPRFRNVIRQVESERIREKDKGLNRDDGLEDQLVIVFSENLTNCETRAAFVI
jgi:hypothetical protein